MNRQTRQKTREWYRDNALACIAEAESGAIKLASHYPLERYRMERTADAEAYMRGENDHTFAFRQRAEWIETGACAPLLQNGAVMSAQAGGVLAVMDRSANLLPTQECCGLPQWSGNPDEPPECCGQPCNPQDEMREASAVVAELIAALEDARDRLAVVIECDNEDHGGASPEDVAAFNRATAALAALDAGTAGMVAGWRRLLREEAERNGVKQ